MNIRSYGLVDLILVSNSNYLVLSMIIILYVKKEIYEQANKPESSIVLHQDGYEVLLIKVRIANLNRPVAF